MKTDLVFFSYSEVVSGILGTTTTREGSCWAIQTLIEEGQLKHNCRAQSTLNPSAELYSGGGMNDKNDFLSTIGVIKQHGLI